MNSIIQTTEILKADSKGRLRMSAQRREAMLDEFEKSGISGRAFVKMTGVKYQTFASWLQKRRKAREVCASVTRSPSTAPVKFTEALIVEDADPKAALTIELPGGARVQMHGAHQLEMVCQLLATLAKKEATSC